nr:isochorismatase family protein [Azospirillum sp. INR13]
MHLMILRAQESVLVVVDVQERLLPAIHESDRVIRHAGMLLKAAAALSVPVLVTEQYPPRPWADGGGGARRPAARHPGDREDHLRLHRRTGLQRRGGGTEASADRAVRDGGACLRDANGAGAAPAGPCGLSRRGCGVLAHPANHAAALERMRAAGVTIVTTEMVLFEWMERAGTPVFKVVSALVK